MYSVGGTIHSRINSFLEAPKDDPVLYLCNFMPVPTFTDANEARSMYVFLAVCIPNQAKPAVSSPCVYSHRSWVSTRV